MLRRVGILLLALAFVVGWTTQMMPRALAIPQSSLCPMGMVSEPAEMSADADQSSMPCKGMTPTCIDVMGCVVTVAVPLAPLSTPTVLKWAEVAYSCTISLPTGRSVPPDLFPPIIAV